MNAEPPRYISYFLAHQILKDRLQATEDEVAIWVWWGKHNGGLTAYETDEPLPVECSILSRWKSPTAEECADSRCDRCTSLYDAPRQFHFAERLHKDIDPSVSPSDFLLGCYFLRDAIDAFDPQYAGRFLSGAQVLDRWKSMVTDKKARELIHVRFEQEKLSGMHPLFGSYPYDGRNIPLERAMFSEKEIEAIENEFGSTTGGSHQLHELEVDANSTWTKPTKNFLTTSELVALFGGYMGVGNPARVLSEYPKWATRHGALEQKGRKGRGGSALWNPVQFALNLLEKRPIPMLSGIGALQRRYLNTVFQGDSLSAWAGEWNNTSSPKYRRP